MSQLNIIEKSATFPDDPENEIIKDATITALQKRFSATNQRIVVAGPAGSGKTTHLSQFVRQFPDRCFSYFITDNFWSWSQGSFLLSLCSQMSVVLGNEISNPVIDLERLNTLFTSLWQQIVELVKRNKTPYYFVIDGLEFATQGASGERIIDILPQTHARGLYLLASCRSESKHFLSFPYDLQDPQLFNRLETQTYLADSGIDSSQIKLIHEASAGFPGYLQTMKMLHAKGIPLAQVLDQPGEVETLLKIHWKSAAIDENEQLKAMLGLLAFSLVPLGAAIISEILSIDTKEVESSLAATGLAKSTISNGDSTFQFHPDLLRKIAQNRLQSLQSHVLSQLTNYHERHQADRSSQVLLTQYYQKQGNFQALQKLLIPEYIITTVQRNQDLTPAMRDLRQACEMAEGKSDMPGVLKFGLAASQVQSLSTGFIGKSEVRALAALKQFEKALELAYSASLLELRIKLLAQVYMAMERAGIVVQRQSLAELDQMLQTVSATMDADETIDLAMSVFPLLPDSATSLIEQARGVNDSRNIVDIAIALAAIESSDAPNMTAFEAIEESGLRELVMTFSPWLSNLSVAEVLERAAQLQKTSAKEYLLRQWCLQNKSNSEAYLVINAALDAIISDSNYSVPLRSLRQLSDVAKLSPANQRETLSKRFDIPNFTSLGSPIEERLRLELNLSEAIFEISPQDSIERFIKTYLELWDATLDADIGCYCFVRVLISLRHLDPNDTRAIQNELLNKIKGEYERLLKDSANQLEVSGRTLRALSTVEPFLALDFVKKLNLNERRENGCKSIIGAHLRQVSFPLNTNFIDAAFSSIQSRDIKDEAFLVAISEAKRSKRLNDETLRDWFLRMINQIIDPIIKCEAVATLIGSLTDSDLERLRQRLFELFLSSWQEIDVIWMRVELGFQMVDRIAAADAVLGLELLEKSKQLRDTTSLATQSIGIIFYQQLVLATRLVGHLDLSTENANDTWTQLLSLVEYVPSTLLRSQLLSSIALERLKSGDKARFDSLMRDNVIPGLRAAGPSRLRDQIVSALCWPLFEYSPAEARALVNSLPYEPRNEAWRRGGLLLLANAGLNDPISAKISNNSIDSQCANKVLEFVENSSQDTALYSLTRAFSRAISEQNNRFTEAQRLDFLDKLENIIKQKLPDLLNIQHSGYLLACRSAIEAGRHASAKRTVRHLKKQHPSLIKEIQNIPNVADKALVLTMVAEDIHKQDIASAKLMGDQAMELAIQIPNVKDRINRLDSVAETFSTIHDSQSAVEAVKMAASLVSGMISSVDRDTMMASIIQVTYEIDHDLAAELTQKIESPLKKSSADDKLKARDLAKSPQKLLMEASGASEMIAILPESAQEMLGNLVTGKGVVYPSTLLLRALSSVRLMESDKGSMVTNWAVESLHRQFSEGHKSEAAVSLVNSILFCSELLFDLGNQISFLSSIPSGIKRGYQGLSTKMITFRGGNREKGITWIRNWLQENSHEYVKIVDPYFDFDQLWVLQTIPSDTTVTIVTTWNQIQKVGKTQLEANFELAWRERSNQSHPPTLVVIHDPEVNEGYHDRFIVTHNSGIALGTSLNGIGSKEFVITILSSENASYIEETYINPKLDIQKFFAKATFVMIDGG